MVEMRRKRLPLGKDASAKSHLQGKYSNDILVTQGAGGEAAGGIMYSASASLQFADEAILWCKRDATRQSWSKRKN